MHVFAGPIDEGLDWEDAVATISPRAGVLELGSRVEAAGDLDGDGFDDLVVEARGRSGADGWSGHAQLVFSGPLEGALRSSDAVATVAPWTSCPSRGRLEPIGDLDGDGRAELALTGCRQGEYPSSEVAAALVPSPLPKTLGAMPADRRLLIPAPYYSAEQRMRPIADVDGAGTPAVAFSTASRPHDSDSAEGYGDRGRVAIFTDPGLGDTPGSQALFQVVGDAEDDYLGWSIATGDLDGDGIDDLVAGAPGSDLGGWHAGAVFVFYGPLQGQATASDADAVLIGEAPSDEAGWIVDLAGDVDGDGHGDLLIGVPGDSAPLRTPFDPPSDVMAAGGSWYVASGPFSGELDLSEVDLKLSALNRPLGLAGRGVGDVDGDGLDDLLLGAPAVPGLVWLVPGGALR